MDRENQSMRNLLAFANGENEFRATLKLSPEIEETFLSLLKKVEFPKGTVLNVPGKPADKIYIIESGLMITTYLLDGKEIGTGFFAEGDIGGDIISFLINRPSRITIKLVEPCVLYVLTHDDLDYLNGQINGSDNFTVKLYNDIIVSQQMRIEDMLSGSSTARYNKFLKRFPDIVYRLPLGFIAAFLGMSQENLSRIRSQKSI